MQFRLRTLLIVLALGPVVLAAVYFATYYGLGAILEPVMRDEWQQRLAKPNPR